MKTNNAKFTLTSLFFIFSGLSIIKLTKYVYKSELINLAYDLIMQDIRPFAEALGINEAKLAECRKDFEIENVGKGTFYLLTQLRESMKAPFTAERTPFCIALRKAGYIEASRVTLVGKQFCFILIK